DDTGRRRALVRRAGRLVALGFVGYLALLAAGFARDPRLGAIGLPTFGLPGLVHSESPPAVLGESSGRTTSDALGATGTSTTTSSSSKAPGAGVRVSAPGGRGGDRPGADPTSGAGDGSTSGPVSGGPVSGGPPTGQPSPATTTSTSSTTTTAPASSSGHGSKGSPSTTSTSTTTTSTTTSTTGPPGPGSSGTSGKGPAGNGPPGQLRKTTTTTVAGQG
ncbi:MAG: hypothetical protein QOJ23_1420, partial [Actinomycetota bacterium]|nr:hypothetical protein [Actinomycetota bacterium]